MSVSLELRAVLVICHVETHDVGPCCAPSLSFILFLLPDLFLCLFMD